MIGSDDGEASDAAMRTKVARDARDPLSAGVIARFSDSHNRLGYVAGVSERGTQRDDLKTGSADGKASAL